MTTKKHLFEVTRKAAIGMAALFIAGCGSSQSTDAPDFILHSGKILTVNTGFEIAEAIAITDGNIAAVGTDEEIESLAGADTTVFDLEGRTIIPGIVDSHSHQDGYGMHIYRPDLSKVGSVAEMMSVVEAKVKESQPGEWITNSGFWNETKLEERRNPTRFDIDPISPDNPVYLGRGHLGIINTKAMEVLGMDEDTASPPGGTIERDEKGRITGRLYERALDPVHEAVPKPTHEQRMGAILQTYKEMAAAGATSVRSGGSPIESIAAYAELNDRGKLLLRTSVTAYLNPNQSSDQIEEWLQRLPPVSEPGDTFQVWGIKMTADGGSDLAYLRRDYANRPGFRGQLGGSLENFTAAVSLSNRYGRRVGIHALGDAAIDFTLDAYEAADAESSIADKRWSIEHGYLIQPEQYPRMKRLGLIIHPQTWHLYHLRRNFVENYGPEYADMTHPYRDLVDQGIPIAGGMDWRVAPHDYFFFMWVAITRKTLDGEVVGPDQALTREEALRFHTLWAAYSTFEEDLKGSLEPGKFADLAVLDNDYLGVEADEIKDIRPLLTMVGGQVVFRDPDYAFP